LVLLASTEAGEKEKTGEKGKKRKERCEYPVWHMTAMKLGDNWPLAGIKDFKTSPKFVLSIKGLDEGNTFTLGKKYKVMVTAPSGKKTLKISSVFFSIDTSDESCSKGTFGVGGDPVKKATATRQCKTMAIMQNIPNKVNRKTKAVWKAPKELDDGCSITIHANILGSDNKLYYDSMDTASEYAKLSMTLTPSSTQA
jgi:hypothetical protein